MDEVLGQALNVRSIKDIFRGPKADYVKDRETGAVEDDAILRH
jgi:hypothetical protein